MWYNIKPPHKGSFFNSMKKRKTLWRIWAKALGEKAGKNDKESDHIAGIRTIILLTYFVTNLFIIAGVIRHWNDNNGNTIQTRRDNTGYLAESLQTAKKEV